MNLKQIKAIVMKPRYNCRLFGALIALLFFNVLDVHFTMLNLTLGAHEANPVMRTLLNGNVALFVFYKYFFASAAIVLFFFLSHRLRFQKVLYCLSAFYSALVIYQVLLFMRLSWPV